MVEKKLKAAMIGPKSVAALYGAAGAAVFEPSADQSVTKLIAKLYGDGYGIIFVSETIYRSCEGALKKYLTDPYPIIIPVPDENSDGTYSKERIAANIKKAIGSDLI
ncbi:MAG: hypothetical protein J5879_04255 [Clostridia bacterium]|nr:hypothetical protein [Clostridia bacterium]